MAKTYINNRDIAPSSVTGTQIASNTVTTSNMTATTLASGTYIPTIAKQSGTATITSSTVNTFRWMRVNNVVTVSGNFSLQPSAGGYLEITISLPVDGGSNNFASSVQANGIAAVHQMGNSGAIFSVTGARTVYSGVSYTDGSNRTNVVHFTYDVV